MKTYHDVPGDGGSRVLEQVGDLRQRIADRLSGVRHRLAIGSGKGGVGKSTLTLQLAVALRAQGWEVGILDADLNGPSQARLAGLMGQGPLPGPNGALLPRTASGIRVLSLGGVLAEPQTLDFDNVAPDESHTWRATRERALLLDLVAGVDWGRLDVLLLDLPPGAERTVQYAEFLGPETAFLLVTLPSELSRGVVARSARALARTENRVLGYVENMSGYWCAPCGALRPLFGDDTSSVHTEADGGLALPCLGRVPFDPALAALCDRGIDSVTGGDSPSVGAVRSVAARVLNLLETP
jgi:ATP-binding protein involved in chromosome partitioning